MFRKKSKSPGLCKLCNTELVADCVDPELQNMISKISRADAILGRWGLPREYPSGEYHGIPLKNVGDHTEITAIYCPSCFLVYHIPEGTKL